MIFGATALAGAYVIQAEPIHDARGMFARTWCAREFAAHGLSTQLAQINVSRNSVAGTLRGLHYQIEPHAEAKLVRCTVGSIYDVIVDLRSESTSYLRWVGVELSAERLNMLYVPEGFAHGFQTLRDDTEVVYQMSEFYAPEAARGIRFDDPAFAIRWPLPVASISSRDADWPSLKPSS